jgi:hypothetical protein
MSRRSRPKASHNLWLRFLQNVYRSKKRQDKGRLIRSIVPLKITFHRNALLLFACDVKAAPPITAIAAIDYAIHMIKTTRLYNLWKREYKLCAPAHWIKTNEDNQRS